MPKIQGFRVKNFKSLKDVTLGRLWNEPQGKPLTPMTAVIGKNGVGKSALFDAFGFLADALKSGVEEACDKRGRGGFEKIQTQGQAGPIEFEVYYKEHQNARPITYEVAIQLDKHKRPYVLRERLRQRRSRQKHGRPFSFLLLQDGKGWVWAGQEGYTREDFDQLIDTISLNAINEGDWKQLRRITRREEPNETDSLELNLEDRRKLSIATLGNLKEHPRISAFRQFVEGWHLSYFSPDSARSLPMAGPQKHLNTHGDNLGNVVQFMEREHPQRFRMILNNIAEKIPGVDRIDTERTSDDRLLLRFNDKGFQDPFYAQQMSDGTLKAFAYLLLLEDPSPPPFLCIEEPENGLYHKLLETLAREFREHSRRPHGAQVFITTHQPYLVDALDPNEVWILEKGADGFSTIRRASDDPLVNNMVAEGLPLGGLWYSDYLDKG